MMEEWKDIVGYEGKYRVSNHGRVHSIRRDIYLKSSSGKNGHLTITLPPHKTFYVHKLVLEAFKGNPNIDMVRGKYEKRADLKVSRHMDGNPANNHIDNLEWGTYEENSNDLSRHSHQTKTMLVNRIESLETQLSQVIEILNTLIT